MATCLRWQVARCGIPSPAVLSSLAVSGLLKFELLATVNIKNTVLWDATLCAVTCNVLKEHALSFFISMKRETAVFFSS